MEKSAELIQQAEKFGAKNYHPLPVVLSRGLGAKVWDVEGKEYLDFLSCYSAVNFGHQHPRIVSALNDQVSKLAVCSRAFHSEQLSHFSQELSEICQLEKSLPMNSGTEAVETALKIARKWGYEKKGVAKNSGEILTMKNNFHGRSITVVSFSTESLYQNGFGPMTSGFKTISFDDISELEDAISQNTVGVLLEPIQAEAGIILPRPGYLSQVRKLCSKHNIPMILDEIQTGMGRTGKNFCFEHEASKPDLLLLGKSLGGGLLPISAVVGRSEFFDVITPGSHGSTFGGNPLACAVARESLRVLDEENLADRSANLGNIIMTELASLSSSRVLEIRGRGSLVGIELSPEADGARRFCEALASRGILCKETHENVIRIAPPLTIEETDLLHGISTIKQVIQELP